jgi:hypothetical protein
MPRKEPAEAAAAPYDAPSVGTSVFPRLPPFTPRTAATWFAHAETCFAAARISDPTVKVATVLTRFEERERERVEDILMGPMLDYENFKSEILQRFAESDNLRIQKLLQSEKIGDRAPSEFYRHLRKLATPNVSEKMVLTLWKKHLPPSVQRVLATVLDSDAAIQTRIADSVYELWQTSKPQHHIETTPGPPVHCKRLAPDNLRRVRDEFEMIMEQGVIRPSKSPWASPLHIIAKKDGGLIPCGDYRALNTRTIPDRYSPPHIEDFAQRLHGKCIFSKIDLVRAYHQFRSRPRTSRKPR